uniref:pyrroline-5-carboxylate reductase family protein n=1 Tax=Halomonas sp. KM-1 TaxID=590061 RepID=UPI000287C5FC
ISRVKRNVMSPGGTTERAVEHMEQAGLRGIVADAMDACAARAREMAEELGQR